MIYKDFVDENGRSIPGKSQEFRTALEKKYGLDGHPKADAVFSLAYGYGHSAGYSEIEGYYMDLADLVK